MSDKTPTISPTDMIQQLRPKDVQPSTDTSTATSSDQQQSDGIQVKDASTHMVYKDTPKVEKIASKKTSQPVSNVVLKDTIQRRSPTERAIDTVKQQLAVYKQEPYGSSARIQALARVVDTVAKFPKKNVLDEILNFFKENRKEEFLDEMHALQAIAQLTPGTRVKVQIIYYIMYSLANNTASKSNISLDMVQNIFKSDEIVAWVSVHLRGTRGTVKHKPTSTTRRKRS